MADDGYQQGWHERNGGNLSYRLKPEEVEMIKPFTNLDSRIFIVIHSCLFIRFVVLFLVYYIFMWFFFVYECIIYCFMWFVKSFSKKSCANPHYIFAVLSAILYEATKQSTKCTKNAFPRKFLIHLVLLFTSIFIKSGFCFFVLFLCPWLGSGLNYSHRILQGLIHLEANVHILQCICHSIKFLNLNL